MSTLFFRSYLKNVPVIEMASIENVIWNNARVCVIVSQLEKIERITKLSHIRFHVKTRAESDSVSLKGAYG